MHDPIIPTRSRQQIAADNHAELDSWIDEHTAALVAAGMTPVAARARALTEFGDRAVADRYARNQDAARDLRIRGLLWLEELGADLRIAARTLMRTSSVTAIVLLTLALGIGATTAVFSVFHAMLLRPLAYGSEATLFYLPAVDNGVIVPGLGGARHSATALAALSERTTTFTGIAGASQGNFILTGRGDPEQLTGAELTSNGFEVLQARAAIGRTFGPGDEKGAASEVVVLMDDIWRSRFGADSNIVGQVIELSGERREVIGVMPPAFRVPTYEQAEFVVPRDNTNILRNPNRAQVRFLRLFGRTRVGTSLEVAQSDVDRTMRSLQAESPQSFSGIETRAVPVRTAVAGDAKPRLLMLMGAAAFVLLIACANVAGILLSRAMARRHELAIRVALGAGRGRLIRQFLAEGLVLATVGAALGLLAAQLGIGALRHVATTALPAQTSFALEPRVVLFAIAASFVAALAAVLVPALRATRVVGVALGRDDARISPSRANRRMRLGLVAAQLAISVVLLVGAGLLLRTLQRLSSIDLGYVTENALTFRPGFTKRKTNAEQDVFYAELYGQLRAIPGVVSVGGGNVPTSGQSTVSGLAIEGRVVPEGRLPDVRYTPASDDYFATLGIPVVRGRVFNSDDRDGAPWVAVVSTGLAQQLWPGGDPIGARVKPAADKEWATVVGVVGDVRMGGADAAQPSIYTSQRQDHWPAGAAIIVRAKGNPATIASGVRQALRRVDPTMPVIGLRTLEEYRRSTPAIAERSVQMQLLLVFAIVALVVSAIGVYGGAAYATEARRKEFGIRMALGATRRRVLLLALQEGAWVALIGAIGGGPLAVFLASRLRNMLYAVEPFDAVALGAALGAMCLIVFVASFVPARRATLIDPARTMRMD